MKMPKYFVKRRISLFQDIKKLKSCQRPAFAMNSEIEQNSICHDHDSGELEYLGKPIVYL